MWGREFLVKRVVGNIYCVMVVFIVLWFLVFEVGVVIFRFWGCF